LWGITAREAGGTIIEGWNNNKILCQLIMASNDAEKSILKGAQFK
jgi:hypothetical protein